MNKTSSHLLRSTATFALSAIMLAATFVVSMPVQQVDAAIGFTDFNGDGFEDLAIGVPNESVGSLQNAGAVNVIYGSSSGLSATVAKADQVWTQNSGGIADNAETDDFFGSSLATGDFNGDGRSDVAIGASGEDIGTVNSAGSVNIIYGSSQGLRSTPVSAGDGRDDQFFSQDSGSVEDVSEADDRMGFSIASGDFNGDGRDDLAIGVRDEDVGSVSNAGAIHVIYGSANGLSPTTIADQFWTQSSPNLGENAEAGDTFGYSLAAGDFNKDGRGDLAVSAPLEDISGLGPTILDAGLVHIIYGSASGLSATAVPDQQWVQGLDILPDNPEAGDRFGESLADGDFNGDEFADLAVGVPHEDGIPGPDVGVVHVVYGSASGLTNAGNNYWWQDVADVEDSAAPSESFGWSLAAGDYNGDGRDDLAIGTPFESVTITGVGELATAGVVHVIYGSASGLSATTISDQLWSQDVNGLAGRAEQGDVFGFSLAAGDFDDDGRLDLVIGVPHEDFDDENDEFLHTVGAVNVIYGTSSGLHTSDNQMVQQNTPSLEETSEINDFFGFALASG